MIRDILYSNPKLKFYKEFFEINKNKKTIKIDKFSINFYPGFITSFTERDKVNFLNVTLKNKIIQSETILDYLSKKKYEKKENHNFIKDQLVDRGFKVSYSKRNYHINDNLFDRNRKSQTFSSNGKTYKLVDYSEKERKIKIKNENQPLILVQKKGKNGEINNLSFIPNYVVYQALKMKKQKMDHL